MLIPNRHNSSNSYRYGFNGKEKDDEIKGEGNSYDFGARMLDSRIGRWFKTDPLELKGPEYSPYCYTFNSPINLTDPDGRWPDLPPWSVIKVIAKTAALKMSNAYHNSSFAGDLSNNYTNSGLRPILHPLAKLLTKAAKVTGILQEDGVYIYSSGGSTKSITGDSGFFNKEKGAKPSGSADAEVFAVASEAVSPDLESKTAEGANLFSELYKKFIGEGSEGGESKQSKVTDFNPTIVESKDKVDVKIMAKDKDTTVTKDYTPNKRKQIEQRKLNQANADKKYIKSVHYN